MSVPTARKIKSQEELEQVLKAAREDKHNMPTPTHVIEKDGKIVGCWGLGNIPLVSVWHKEGSLGPKESLNLNSTFKSIMDDRGHGVFLIACNEDSPYMPFMEKVGYEPVWKTNLLLSK